MTATLTTPRGAPSPTAPGPLRSGAGVALPAVATGAAVLLAALSLSPVFASGAWFGAVLMAVIAVVGVGALATRGRLPVFLVPIAQALALFCALVLRFTVDVAPLGFVPTPDALDQLRAVLAAGVHDVNVYAPPVPVTEGVTAVAALGLGCAAIVVFVLQVCLRLPVLAGLALVSVYVVPALVLDDGAPWWSFAFVAVAFLVLLVSDERVGLASWGRMLRRSEGEARSPLAGFSSAALRLGSLAILAAVVVPAVVPALADLALGRNDSGISGTPGEGGSGNDSAILGLDPFVSLRKNLINQPDTIVMTYTTDRETDDYLRTVVLTSYSGEVWRPAEFSTGSATPVEKGVPVDVTLNPDVAARSPKLVTTITAPGLAASWLPVPSDLTALTIDGGSWFVDTTTRTVFAENTATTTEGRTWTATSLDVAPTADELRAAAPDASIDDTDRLRRAQIPDSLRTLAVQQSQGAGTDYDKAVAIERWLRTSFTYSLATTSNDDPQAPSYLDQFLASKVGFCQQFAATMALMAESLGIPARVVVGFTPGQRQPDGTHVVRGKNAHAWPELFFAGVGWQRFEPTPASSGSGVLLPSYTDPSKNATPTPTGSSTASGGASVKPIDEERDPDGTTFDLATTSTTSADVWRLRGLLALLLVGLVVAAVPAVWRAVRRRRRLSAQAEVEDFWEELRDTARDLGIPWSTARTPRQAVAGVVEATHLRGEERDAAVRVGRATEQARYAPTPPSTVGLADDVTTVRHALLRRAERSTRLRATLLPASLRAPEDRD